MYYVSINLGRRSERRNGTEEDDWHLLIGIALALGAEGNKQRKWRDLGSWHLVFLWWSKKLGHAGVHVRTARRFPSSPFPFFIIGIGFSFRIQNIPDRVYFFFFFFLHIAAWRWHGGIVDRCTCRAKVSHNVIIA